MPDLRPVALTREDIVAIEEAAQARITAGGVHEGFQLLGRCLHWRYESGIAGEAFSAVAASNVVDLFPQSRKVGA